MDTTKHRTGHSREVARLLEPAPPLARVLPTHLVASHGARLLLGFALSGGIGWLAYKRRSLTKGGALGAVATGASIAGLGGWPWGLSLIYFFTSSTLLSHFREKEKARLAADKFSKGSQRDLAQVAANGGLASLYAIAAGSTRSETLRAACEAGFTGALATATADTWATELGTLSSNAPRLVTTGQPVEPGTSGGVTPLGSSAAALGAFSQGLFHWLARGARLNQGFLPLITLISGLTGNLCDSYMGATIQVMYFCPTCKCETERPVHSCGTLTHHLRGFLWCNNDAVNFLATLTGSLTAIVL
ncbi:MAG TPA: DUF92 domain-containing protein, partial [Ktedonobacteraceae bacterium]